MDKHEYLDFELEISEGTGRQYPIAVIRSPAGEAQETMHFPFDELELQSHLKDLQIAFLRSGGKRRQILLPEEQTVQDFGRTLFDALLAGEVRSRYDVSNKRAKDEGQGLRLKLRIQAPELAVLPWEFLYDPRQADYVCLSRNTPVVRYLELPQPIQPLTVTPPLRILGMVASPRDLVPLDVKLEKQRVEGAVKDSRVRGLLELEWLPGQTWRHLQQAMLGGPWHVFHFIGHGGFDRNADEGLIALADEESQTHRLHATELGRLLADHSSLRLVLLNACGGAQGSERDIFSSTASILMRRGIPAVLAMQYEITDQAAIEFARAFYETLAHGLPVDAAVVEARKAVSLEIANTMEWGTPVLYMRTPDGCIFDVESPKPEEAQVQLERQQREERKRREEEARQAELAQAQEALAAFGEPPKPPPVAPPTPSEEPQRVPGWFREESFVLHFLPTVVAGGIWRSVLIVSAALWPGVICSLKSFKTLICYLWLDLPCLECSQQLKFDSSCLVSCPECLRQFHFDPLLAVMAAFLVWLVLSARVAQRWQIVFALAIIGGFAGWYEAIKYRGPSEVTALIFIEITIVFTLGLGLSLLATKVSKVLGPRLSRKP